MEAIWLCQQLIRSASKRNDPPPGRAIAGAVQFKGCGFDCDATVRVSQGDVQIFCGIEGGDAPSPGRLPRAMVLAAPVTQERTQEQARQRRA